ncbi:MAG: MBL fold metallo-hydrolase [Candidatus Magasanikbacteria bacterium]|nr:MBL fold metallo-hydrolase [Candidatus Magasanikbacteria bacterium]
MLYKNISVEKIFHAGIKIKNNSTVIYVDPLNLPTDSESADFVLITHEHLDHLSPNDIKKISGKNTVIITTPLCAKKISGIENKQILHTKPGKIFDFGNLKISAVPAYNTNKFRSPGVPFHPKEHGGVGFVLGIDGVKIYHAGDTDVVPEMSDLKDVDVALLPVSGIFVMTPEEAAEAAGTIKPALAIPIHYGDFEFNGQIVGAKENGAKFKSLCNFPTSIV